MKTMNDTIDLRRTELEKLQVDEDKSESNEIMESVQSKKGRKQMKKVRVHRHRKLWNTLGAVTPW